MQREVIKWIQTLDLSFPVHNPRRDLMNGFVVAEILSRYDKNVSMHSFDTGSALAKRLDNWAQIKKTLARLGCKGVTDDLVALVLQGRDGAGRRVLEELYMFLTKRKLHPTPADNGTVGASAPLGTVGAAAKVSAAAELPAYMRPTAAKLLRDENDATKERYAQLTGQTDQLKAHQENEAALETHEVGLQAQKFQEPERFKPKPRPPPDSAKKPSHNGTMSGTRGGGSATVSGGTESRTRQKLQQARQLAVRGIDESILSTFQQRQEHEREEQFKAQFDAKEDLATALSRVCVRPLGQAGLTEALDDFAAAANGDAATHNNMASDPFSGAGGLSQHTDPHGVNASAISATGAAAATGDYYCKFVEHRGVVPPEAKRLVWQALHGAAQNIAKHVHARSDEVHHLAFSLSFALKRATWSAAASAASAATANPAAAASEMEDAEAALELLALVGAQWQKIDLDAPTQAAASILVPAWADLLASAPPELLRRLGAVLGAFCNHRDVESYKKVVVAVAATAGAAEPSVNALLAAALLETADAKLCLGLEDVLEYYATSFLTSLRSTDRACGLRLLRALAAGTGSSGSSSSTGNTSGGTSVLARLEAFLPAVTQLLSDPDWEVRLAALHLACALQMANQRATRDHQQAALRAGSVTSGVDDASPRADSVTADSGAGGANTPGPSPATAGASSGGGPAFLPTAQVEELLLAAFDSLDACSALVRRASLCAVAHHLDYDGLPALCDTFIARLLGLGPEGVEETVRGGVAASSSGGEDGAGEADLYRSASAAGVQAVPSRVVGAHVAGGVVQTWNSVAVACALVNARPQRTTYEFLSVLQPLVHDADLNGSDRAVWLAVAEQSKSDIVDAVYNPASMRGVPEGLMQPCARLAGAVAVRLYQEMSGEDDADLHEALAAGDPNNNDALDVDGGAAPSPAEEYARKLQERALEWLQAAL